MAASSEADKMSNSVSSDERQKNSSPADDFTANSNVNDKFHDEGKLDKSSKDEDSSGSEYESAEEDQNIIDDEEEELEEILTEEVKKERRSEAQEQKEKGNDFFKKQEYENAVNAYTRALRLCPKDFIKDRAILYSNRAACKMKESQNEEAIMDSNKALELHPQYLKALLRRAELYEKVDKLEEALTDYQKVVEMDPTQHSARAACLRLPDQIKEKNEKMKEEMIGKLKELGNMVLKPFGLSTENFQLNQDPNSGGYNISFKQGPPSS
ncbi:tetratricopeptide repeat protein 1-like [Saccostrea echinata]|uniref:tetratricopeptide repeat protein 1-like n=1 Tax=Saccostrea echinata TaxID=191078 RepID=UPI002A83E746|nr:tetratricopeptide repeat protein 1-like [Saccostrea echinata]